MNDEWPNWPEHLEHDEYLRRNIRGVEATVNNLASIAFARLEAIEKHLGLEPEAWRNTDA